MNFSLEQLRWFRLRRSGLVRPFDSPEEVASSLAGIQAQILPAAGLALWQRTAGLTYARFETLLYEQRYLVKLWGQRGTLHLYPSREWPLIHGALANQSTWWERQVERNGGDMAAYRAAVAQVAALLRQQETLGRSDLRAADLELEEEFFSPWGGIFYDLVRQGHACHAAPAGNEGRFAHRENWLPDLPWQPPGRDEANIELARRYLAAYGPATVQDLAYWRGAKVGEARRWLAGLGDEVGEIETEAGPLLARQVDLDSLAEVPPPADAWPVRLLYRFDPLLLGLKDKSWIIDPADYSRVWRPAGHIEGSVLVHGRVAGAWRYDRKGSGLVVSVFPFAPLPLSVLAAVEQNAAGVAAFFGLALVDVVIKEMD